MSPEPRVVSLAPSSAPDAEPSTPQRILDATAHRVAIDGAAALSLADVAADAGVSKALIHYHFHDKDTLLARLVAQLSADVAARERAALEGQRTPLAIDALWDCLVDELRAGTLRSLIELALHPSPTVRDAARHAADRRRASAVQTITRLFAILELRPRVPIPQLAAVLVAFTDGLALAPDHDHRAPDTAAHATRAAFDVFWLAMLHLAE